jgi:hypothetical protein
MYLFFCYHLSVRTTINIFSDGAKTKFLEKIQFLLRLKKRTPWCVRTEASYKTNTTSDSHNMFEPCGGAYVGFEEKNRLFYSDQMKS